MTTETRGSVRQRKAQAAAPQEKQPLVEEVDSSEAEEIERNTSSAPKPRPSPKQRLDDEDEAYSPWVDILRVLSFLAVASCALSYLISGGESYMWGVRHTPRYMQVEWWKSQLRGPIYLTPAELATYDGTDETLPVYLAINGTIYDVSSNRRTYGPGGSYRFFAGADASRSYVTGCFAEDRTADMRGVEDMYLPLDDAEVDKHWTAADMAALREKELAEARRRVHEGLLHWVKFFENNAKYPRVGYVKREEGWLEREPRRELCKTAAKGRKPRKIPGKE
ncbi:Uu.00g074080.m01.CDS01 [Anthostomella pinea]|uniref:Uu.00g074080.m01.CDS01 n=1 Tax=Anthostomella pinea TaxID=933095 RepID=A0AAI8VVG5_9PEZI|nr:Uu.00g074080.m01.CDS01 [Anthostomella pinea]